MVWSEQALSYFAERAIDPEVAEEMGVIENPGGLEFPYPYVEREQFVRSRSLTGTGPKVRQPPGTRLCPWQPEGHRGALMEALVCEGESDALAALTALRGAPVGHIESLPVVAIPGTGLPVRRMVEFLMEAKVAHAWLALDADDAGRGYTDRLVEDLSTTKIRVSVVELPDGRDLADCLAAVAESERGDWIANLLVDSEAAAPEEERVSPVVSKSTLLDFSQVVARPVRWGWHHRVALAKITGLAGRPKIGKGLLYSHLIASVTLAQLDGDLDGPRDAIIVTTEDDPGDTLKPRLMAAGADLSRVSIFQMGSRDEPVPFRVPQDAAELGRRVAEKDAALVVIDPLVEFIDGRVDSHKSHPVRQAIAALNQIARETGCAIVVIFHLNKGASTDPLLRHEGSAAFSQVVRGGLMLGHDPDDPDGEDGNQRVLAVSASNLAPIAPSIVYRIETRRVAGDTGEVVTTARMVPIGTSGANAHDLLKGRGQDERTERDEAVEFLRAELADGPRPAKEINAARRDAGIAEITLRRAKAELKVSSRRSGFGPGSKVEWALPIGDHPPVSAYGSGPGDHLCENPLSERGCDPSVPAEIPIDDHHRDVSAYGAPDPNSAPSDADAEAEHARIREHGIKPGEWS